MTRVDEMIRWVATDWVGGNGGNMGSRRHENLSRMNPNSHRYEAAKKANAAILRMMRA